MPRIQGRDAIYEIANQWRDRCLVGDGSLLWPTHPETTWTGEQLTQFLDVYVGNPDTSSKSFYEKLKEQLQGGPDFFYRITADILVIYSLFPTNWGAESKRTQLHDFLEWWEHEPIDLPELDTALSEGLGNQGLLTAKYWHVAYHATLSRAIKINEVDPHDFATMVHVSNQVATEIPQSSSARNIVMHLLFPTEAEPISSDSMLNKIDSGLSQYCTVDGDRSARISSIRSNLSKELGRDYFLFWDPDVKPLWDSVEKKNVTAPKIHSGSGKPGRLDKANSESKAPNIEHLASLCNLPSKTLHEFESLIQDKKQIILEGPPGSGKTWVARLFARYLAGLPLLGESDDRVEIVQFHQSYGYEDFVAGIRPITNELGSLAYETRPGIFVEMCQRANERPDGTFVLIIDEINRGNLSRIFGELLYGLEYRDQPVRMQYPVQLGENLVQHLTIPDNLLLIGTMNSTDRSLALIDYALRRRFYFIRLMPVVDGRAPVLESWLNAQPTIDPEIREWLLGAFIALNQDIERRLGVDYQIGHSYFMLPDGRIADGEELGRIWRYAIDPLLREYFHTRHDLTDQIRQLETVFFGESLDIDSELSDYPES